MNNTVNSTTLHILNNHIGTPDKKSTTRKRTGLRQHELEPTPPAAILSSLQQSIDDLLASTEATELERPNLSWPELEAAGIAELLRIHQDGLQRALSESEYARTIQIVASLNAHQAPDDG